MKVIYRGWIIFSLAALALSLAFAFYARHARAQGVTPPPPESDTAITEAVQNAVQKNQQHVLGFLINKVEVNRIVYAKDSRTALVWLAQRDPSTGDIIGREPAIAIARNPNGSLVAASDWNISFEFSGSFATAIDSLPPDLITDEARARFLASATVLPNAAQVFTGYKLPWSTALSIKITGSIGHFLDYGSCAEVSCRYAYDFWNPDPSNRMFPILASKGGVVQAYKTSCSNGDPNCTNYLVLRDDSTTPTTYQLYYHMANNSVPANFQPGVTYVQQGQYVGNVDDTGFSSDHHLHFMVYATPTGANYSWGNSIEIKFADVPFNGGEPRTCAETVNYPSYGTECSLGPDGRKLTADDDTLQSGNVGAFPPSGNLGSPAPWTTLTDKILNVSGAASDNLGIARVQVLVNTDGAWRSISNANLGGGGYSAAVDMCAAGIQDGPFALAVRIWDIEGNWVDRFTGTRQLFKNAPCGAGGSVTPVCAPAADEVALYSDINFSGTCKKFTPGKYQAVALAPVGDNATQSLQVGTNVRAVLFDLDGDQDRAIALGRMETFTVDDPNLADNRIGAKMASALWVQTAADITNPSTLEPFLTFPGNRLDADHNSRVTPNPPNPKSSDSLVLAWTGGKGAMLFSGNLSKGGVTVKTMPEQTAQSWSVGSLDAGTYNWTVTACNLPTTCAGATTNSTTLTFTVDPAALPAGSAINAPTPLLDMQSGPGDWVASGLWHWGDVNRLQDDMTTISPTKAWIYNNGVSINDPTTRAGDLTSPPINITANGAYYLHFRFFSGVEGISYAGQNFAGSFWDQRRVQISVNGGAFTDLPGMPFSDDTQNSVFYWPQSSALPLGNLSAGQTLRVRFHFDAIDENYNDYYGWAIDDVQVDTNGPDASCKDNNDTPASATPITLGGAALNGVICPNGDVDYYSFNGVGGTPVRIKVDAKSLNPNDPLDSFMQLIDSSGKDVIAVNDDMDPTNPAVQYRDSLIELVLPRSGMYYIRVKAWHHPGAGGPAYTYRLTLAQNSATPRPSLSVIDPPDPKHLPIIPFIVSINASDPNGSGVKRADFFWHSNDWANGSWTKFASDTTPADGWWGIFNPPGDTTGSAFYFLATNNAGGSNGILITDLAPDLSVPSSSLNPLPATTRSTAVQLSWIAGDVQNDIDRFDLQYRFNGGAWTDWATHPAGWATSAWFIGQPGAYQFRLRAVDRAGNQEAFPSSAEASTTVAATCANDTSEPTNNTRTGASALAPAEVRALVFCQNDTDWVSFQAQQDSEYLLMFPSLSGGAAVHFRLYDPGATTVLLEGQAPGPGQGLAARWTAPANGTYTIEMTPADPAVWGTDARYQVYAGPGKWFYFPVIGR